MKKRKQRRFERVFSVLHNNWDIALTSAVVTVASFIACLTVTDIHEKAEPPVIETVPQATVIVFEPKKEIETVATYDAPLDLDLQLFIVQVCEEHHIDPSVVIAMIERESRFKSDVIGDNGNSFGLMQIQAKWHQERMDKLGVTDLLDPYQNVTVGVDYLAEMINRGKGLEWALTAYNGGASYANKVGCSSYATSVIERSADFQEGMVTYVLD